MSETLDPAQREKAVTQLRGRLERADPGASFLKIPIDLCRALVTEAEPCGMQLADDFRFGPCVRVDGHEWHRDASGAAWIESTADMQRRVRT